jgi:hypothetical protein
MKTHSTPVALGQALLLSPALLFMGSLVVRMMTPLRVEPAHTAHQIVMWYAARLWTLWILLIALPLAVLAAGCATLLRSRETGSTATVRRALAATLSGPANRLVLTMTVTAAAILTIVALHVAAN